MKYGQLATSVVCVVLCEAFAMCWLKSGDQFWSLLVIFFGLIGMLHLLTWNWQPSLRFSLRTLLIAMTVAAIGLGWIVYAWRK